MTQATAILIVQVFGVLIILVALTRQTKEINRSVRAEVDGNRYFPFQDLTRVLLTFSCFLSSSRPVPEIFWYQNGSIIKDFGDSFLFQNYNRTLRLGSLHPKRHGGVYRCEAVGNLRNISASFQIKVLGRRPLHNI